MGTKIRGRLHAAAVDFQEVECCAIKFAIGSGCHYGFIKKSLTEAYKIEPKRNWINFWLRIWRNTFRLSYIPNGLDFKFYAGLAIAERARLRGDGLADYVLPCGHKASNHIKALTNISLGLAVQQRN